MPRPKRSSPRGSPVPVVTVVIPTYHWSSVLRLALASVLRQTFVDYEVLVVGDACTDDSGDVVRAIGDARVRWINLPAHHGHQWGSNNEGLRQARGEFIAYLGHDDLWLPHHLACVVEALRRGADLAYTLCVMVHGDGVRSEWAPARPKQYRPGMGIPPTCVAHRRSVIAAVGPWRDYHGLDTDPDRELWRRIHAAGYRLEFVPRLSAIKFPAVWRRGVYSTKPCHEQARWSARIAADPLLEATELSRLVACADEPRRLSSARYADVCLGFARETWRRIRGRVTAGSFRAVIGRNTIDAVRRHKGLGRTRGL